MLHSIHTSRRRTSIDDWRFLPFVSRIGSIRLPNVERTLRGSSLNAFSGAIRNFVRAAVASFAERSCARVNSGALRAEVRTNTFTRGAAFGRLVGRDIDAKGYFVRASTCLRLCFDGRARSSCGQVPVRSPLAHRKCSSSDHATWSAFGRRQMSRVWRLIISQFRNPVPQ
jgi:hypothetical protein